MRNQSGFTIIEVLIALFLIGLITIAIVGLAVLGTRTSFESERQNVAIGIANEVVEQIRGLDYDNVGLQPDGILTAEQPVTRNQQTYDIALSVELVDDAANGSLPANTLTETNADFKRVKVVVSWQTASGNTRDVALLANIVPDNTVQTCEPGAVNACASEGFPGNPGNGACVPNTTCPDSGICPSEVNTRPYCPTGVLFCPQCYTGVDCGAGFTCQAGACVAAGGVCYSDSDCNGAQSVCQQGQCLPNCNLYGCNNGELCNTTTGVCSLPCDGN
jgi:type II secretory pathway pseudopilin PulG